MLIFADIFPIFGAQEVSTPRSPSAADIPAGVGESHDDSGMHLQHGASFAACQECTQDLAELQLFGHSMSEAAIADSCNS